MSVELRPYQQERLKYHLLHDRSLELLACGLGKTPLMAQYSRIQLDCFHECSCWIMPSSLLTKNRDDLIRFGDYKEEELAICNGTPIKRRKQYEDPNIKVYLMSGDCFAKEWELLPKRVGVLVFDEWHLIGSTHDSQRTQSIYRASRRFKKIKMLTATICRGRYSSAYPAIAIIEPRYFCTYQNFLHYFAVYNRWNQIVAWRNGEKLAAVLERVSSGLKSPDLKLMAPVQYIMENCNFDENQKAAYKELEEEGLLELEDRFLDTKGSGGVKAIRCRQILSTPEKLGLKIGFNGKLDMVKTHLLTSKEEDERTLIFSCFIDEQEKIKELCDSIGVRAEIMNGSVSSQKRGEIASKFEKHEIDVIIGSENVLSTGFNFEFIKEILLVSLSYDNSDLTQSVGRGNRGTRTRPLLVYVIGYNTRIERRILQIITRKNQELKKVLDIES